jgi:hypothetical protein
VVVPEPPDGTLPAEARGYNYLIEVGLAKEVLQVWSAWRSGEEPSASDTCAAVIYYAVNDTYLPVHPGG